VEESDSVDILTPAVPGRNYATYVLCRLLIDGPATVSTVTPSTIRQLARPGLIVRAGRERTNDGWRVAWAIRDRRAVLNLLARLNRCATTYLFPE
jgi:hypothetical protein